MRETPTNWESLRWAALIFDCDGTLADTLGVHADAFDAALQEVGSSMPRAWFFERVGFSRLEILRQHQEHFGHPFDPDVVATFQMEHFKRLLDRVLPIEPVVNIAREHAGRMPMAVASGGNRPLVEAILNVLGIRELFDVVVTVEDVSAGKPAPDLFLEAARRLGVAAEHCLVFEDAHEGLVAAERAGMVGVDIASLRNLTVQ